MDLHHLFQESSDVGRLPQIETENGNKTVSNLERILEDYRAVRQENAALAAKVREA